jgi:hypothetical protein
MSTSVPKQTDGIPEFAISGKPESLLRELAQSFYAAASEKHSPHSKIFLMFLLSLSIT